MTSISILICTHNHAEALAATLASIAQTVIPANQTAELIVVANACSDDTARVIEQSQVKNMPMHFIKEPKKGKGYAYAAGLAAASGGIVIFTDDDVRVPKEWLAGMSAPILAGTTHAVAGAVQMAPHLRRPWMQSMHRAMQAETALLDPLNPEYLVGANMAVSRPALDAIGGFDLELGPGGLGYGDDYLLGLQLKKHGFKLLTRFDVIVEHHFDATRLERRSWLAVAEKQGRTNAYLAHHWEHRSIAYCRLQAAMRILRLLLWRILHPHRIAIAEGCDPRELVYLRSAAFYRHYLRERTRSPNYPVKS